MEGTIGGKSIAEVFRNLQVEIPGGIEYREDRTSYPYLKISKLKAFFEGQVPPENYDFLCGPASIHQLNGEGFIACTGTIVIYDDNGQPLRRRSHVGAVNLTFSKVDGSLNDPAAAVRAAVTAARKGCMMAFGCGEKQLDEEKERQKQQKKDGAYARQSNREGTQSAQAQQSSAQAGNGSIPYGEGQYFVRAKEKARIRSAKSYFLIPVLFRDGKETNVLVWRNAFKNPERVADQIAAGNEVLISGVFEPYGNGDRIVCKKVG